MSSLPLLRKTAIFGALCLFGLNTALMIAAQDPIRTRADTILTAIKSNAAKLDPAQVPAYYALVTMNIRSLVSVLGYVE